MAFSIIIVLYLTIGLLAAAGSVFISKKLFPAKGEQVIFAIFLIAIAGFYLAFTAYFGDEGAWRFETSGVAAFAVFGLLGTRVPAVLIIGYFLHGLWDMLHEFHAHASGDLFDTQNPTEIPLAYGFFCAAYDWCMAWYFFTRRESWNAAWRNHSGVSAKHQDRPVRDESDKTRPAL